MLRFTFGKYKNQSIHEVFQKDRQYIKWLCSQLWFKNNHYNLYEGSMNEFNEYTPKINKDKFIAYTDGACPNNGNIKAKASIGIHFSEKNPIKIDDISQVLNTSKPSNNIAELSAIYKTFELLKENDVKIMSKDFIRDVGFMNEVLKSILFRELGYTHPLSDLIPYIIVPTKTKDKKDVYTKFRGDIVVELIEYLEGDYEEE